VAALDQEHAQQQRDLPVPAGDCDLHDCILLSWALLAQFFAANQYSGFSY